ELEPYAPDSGRVAMRGPDLDLPSRLAVVIGMAFHELATNAAKYGALSSPPGRVEIEWRREEKEIGQLLTIDWRESDGPPVRKPRRLGFGSRLIRQTITAELAGSLELDFAPTGVCCRMAIPLGTL
ncbi:MAG TPA: histidine kinase, partial [Microvirga sp.]|nr:histidine kinase [Microvirga sp.]